VGDYTHAKKSTAPEQTMNANSTFLNTITAQARDMILDSIAIHYGISRADALAEVSDEEAEHLLDYMLEPARSAAHVLMQKHRMM
jgi:hypothetical protein